MEEDKMCSPVINEVKPATKRIKYRFKEITIRLKREFNRRNITFLITGIFQENSSSIENIYKSKIKALLVLTVY